MSHTLNINEAASRIIVAAAGFALSISDLATNPPPPGIIQTMKKFHTLHQELQERGGTIAVELSDVDIVGLAMWIALFVDGVDGGLVAITELEERQLCQIVNTLHTYAQEASDAAFGE